MRDTYVKKYGLIKCHLFDALFLFTTVTEVFPKTKTVSFSFLFDFVVVDFLMYLFKITSQLPIDVNNIVSSA